MTGHDPTHLTGMQAVSGDPGSRPTVEAIESRVGAHNEK